MNASAADQLVARYLARLQAALRDLPAARRDELLEQVSEHIAAARAELGAQASEAEIRTLLERLGDPAAIAAEAGHASDELVQPPPARPGWMEVAALVLLPIGGIVDPKPPGDHLVGQARRGLEHDPSPHHLSVLGGLPAHQRLEVAALSRAQRDHKRAAPAASCHPAPLFGVHAGLVAGRRDATRSGRAHCHAW